MKTLIVDFSQTGNTRRVSESICQGMVEAAALCELVSLSEVGVSRFAEYDLIGLGFPVHYFQAPFFVQDFLDGLPDQKDRLWFVFCSHGAIMGTGLTSVWRRLEEKGAALVGFHDSYANATAPFLPYPTLTEGHPDTVDIEKARSFGREVAERARKIAGGETIHIARPETVSKNVADQAKNLTRDVMKQIMPELRIDPEKCQLCRTCEENCPAGGIVVDEEPPAIQNPCIFCWRCVMVCPELAIDTEDWSILSEGYASYRKLLDKASTQGRFRWLVDPDAIDFNDTQLQRRKRKLDAEKPME
ncbi:MAG: 4Fe-4S ferredoxin [Proteobacteria bacterium]|nr:4Fe-4S ferredoxin [Pseudomonadota bacterium]